MSPTRARWPCCCPAPTSTTPPRWRCPGLRDRAAPSRNARPGPLAVLAPEAWPAALGEASLALWRHAGPAGRRRPHAPNLDAPPGLSFDRMAEDNSLVLAYEAYRYYGALAEDPAQPLWTWCARIAAGTHPPGRLRSRPATPRRRHGRLRPRHAGPDRCSCPPATRPPTAGRRRPAPRRPAAPGNFLGAAAISLPAGFDGEDADRGAVAGAGGRCGVDGLRAAVEVLGVEVRRPGWGLGGCRNQGGQARGCGVWATGNLPLKVVLDSVFSTACTARTHAALTSAAQPACAAANAWSAMPRRPG